MGVVVVFLRLGDLRVEGCAKALVGLNEPRRGT